MNLLNVNWITNPKPDSADCKSALAQDTTLEDITSPDFDYEKKVITSSWRSSCCDRGCSTYKYINGKITMIEEFEIADDFENPGQQIITTKKLIDGEMKLVERKIEKIKDDK